MIFSSVDHVPKTDPVALFDAIEARYRNRFLWCSPDQQTVIVGGGAVATVAGGGTKRFKIASRQWSEVSSRLGHDHDPGKPALGPLLLGGFAFGPTSAKAEPWETFGNASLVVPEVMLTVSEGNAYLTTNRASKSTEAKTPDWLEAVLGTSYAPRQASLGNWRLHPAPSAEEWKRQVAELARRLASGAPRKVVLARKCLLFAGGEIDVPETLASLRDAYPDCYVFAIGNGDKTFIGASPERLVKLNQGWVEAGSLAGSMRRGAAGEEDDELCRQLLLSHKERDEHNIVTRALREDLEAAGVRLDAPPASPTVRKLRNVQHLFTPVQGRVTTPLSILDLAGALHPTPAVGGYPRAEALRAIARIEGFERGWYAGPIGWVNQSGDGEMAVGIRSALIQGTNAWLYAGCGILPDSDPESELAESQLKLQPILGALAVRE
ncbi:MAG: isochorismate synthase [Chloroflexi bacterium]|nr:isochorismate synthase [Chloroflexota bacterium]